jgi:hypothetical protein
MDNQIRNPYNPSFGHKPERFLGREIIVDEIISAFDDPSSPWRTTLLIGVRGSGKTALLNDINESVDSNFIKVFISPNSDMLDVILSQIYSQMPKSFIKSIPNLSKVTIAGSIELDINNDEPYFLKNFRHQITKMLDELRKKDYKVLFLIDESQKHSDAMRIFISTYQSLINEKYNVHLIMAGLPNVITDILNDNVLTFLRRAHQVELDNVDLLLVSHDYKLIFKDKSKISDDLLDQAAMITKGYPYLIQLVGYYLWRILSSDNHYENILDQVVVQAKSMMFQNVHKLLFKELSSGDKLFVNAMAVDSNISNFADITLRTGKTKSYLSNYRARLINLGYIKPIGRGELVFTLPFTRDYLLREIELAEF